MKTTTPKRTPKRPFGPYTRIEVRRVPSTRTRDPYPVTPSVWPLPDDPGGRKGLSHTPPLPHDELGREGLVSTGGTEVHKTPHTLNRSGPLKK